MKLSKHFKRDLKIHSTIIISLIILYTILFSLCVLNGYIFSTIIPEIEFLGLVEFYFREGYIYLIIELFILITLFFIFIGIYYLYYLFKDCKVEKIIDYIFEDDKN